MKNSYQVFYVISGLLIVIVLLGGSLTRPVFNNFAEKSLNSLGITKSSVDSIDGSIDEVLYKVNQVTSQVEKLRGLFLNEKSDEKIVEKRSNEIMNKNVYKPIIEIITTIFRLIVFLIAFIILFLAVILHLINKWIALRNMVKIMGERLNRLEFRNP